MTRSIRAVLAGGALALLAACGSSTASTATTAAAPTTAASTTAASTTAAPTTVASTTSAPPTTTPAAGVPTHIVSLSPTGTEMLFAIGAGDQVVAVDDQSNYPAEALAKKTDLSGFTPNVEAISTYHPDLVVIGDDSQHLSDQLGKLGIEVWVGLAATTFDDTYQQLHDLGVATGHQQQADDLVASMKAKIAAAVASAPGSAAGKTYYHELDNTFFTLTSNTFAGRVYSLFGLKNIADGQPGGDYPQLSAEYVISQNPAYVFLADSKCCGQDPAAVGARAGWSAIAAVKGGKVITIDDDIASRWGPRLVDYVQAVAAALSK